MPIKRLMRFCCGFAVGLLLLAPSPPTGAPAAPLQASATLEVVRTDDLPAEARQTLALIRKGGPYPYSRDGAVFANREGRLPRAPRGTYLEYTVYTPGSRDRGARRIIAARGKAFWYTADHYRSFRRIIE